MPTTLSRSGTTLTLPSDMQWADEFAWAAVTQRTEYSITGALLVEPAARQAGRPITLRGGATFGWVQRSVLNQLGTWANIAGAEFSLVLHGATARTVIFDHERSPIEATPVADYAEPDSTDFYEVTLRFIEI